jgi:predicted cupin superfamily sugar epimerase
MVTAEEIINLLKLKPLSNEGGYFVETYKSDEVLSRSTLPERYGSDRSLSTAIYYLLTPDSASLLHRLKSDEVIHFYLGDPVTMLQLHPDRSSEVITLGSDLKAGERPQVVVSRNVWQGMCLVDGGKFALLGTTVAPEFTFEDFELGNRRGLIEKYPASSDLIQLLT